MPRLPILTATALTAALLLVGCGEDSSGDAAAPTTVTVVQERVTVTEDSEAASAPNIEGVSEASASADDEGGGTDSGNITVPNVVGKDHQLAQDTMQAAGLYNLAEEDATGQGRMLIVDRNWTVVSQSPSAGSKVSEDTTIVLRSKKDGE